MKALTIRQPWASLVAAGVKTIETCSWKTSYRGPIAIHAGAVNPADGTKVGPWSVYRQADGTRALDTEGTWRPLPLGAVVATATLTDCLPIVYGRQDFSHLPAQPGRFVEDYLSIEGRRLWVMDLRIDGGIDTVERIEDQRPLGVWSPGRFAWLLTDVTPIDPVPVKGKQGLWEVEL